MPIVTRSESPVGFPLLHIDHPEATATIALHGGHVMQWTPRGQRPVLYMSPDSLFAPLKPIRGGIPICWPWFGPHAGNPQLPGHGVARLHEWELETTLEDSSGVQLTLRLRASEQTLAAWPHLFDLCLVISFGSSLDVALTMKHLGSEPADFTAALHTYLAVGSIHQTQVLGLEDAAYLDSLQDHANIASQHEPITFDREVDRIYLSSGSVIVRDPTWQRDIPVHKSGSQATVVWNPWIEKSKRLADLPDEAYPGFLCIEAANAGPDIIRLAPGESHTLRQTIGPVA